MGHKPVAETTIATDNDIEASRPIELVLRRTFQELIKLDVAFGLLEVDYSNPFKMTLSVGIRPSKKEKV